MEPVTFPVAVRATDVAPRAKATGYPEPFASRVAGREKRVLGDLFGLTNFGVNLTRLMPLHVTRTADGKWSYTRKDGSAY